MLVYPFAIVPFAYCHSYLFDKTSTAMTFTIYQNLMLGGFGNIAVFAFRMIKSTAIIGDRMMWFMRFINPNYCVCDSVMYSATRDFMPRARLMMIEELQRKFPGRKDVLPRKLFRWEPMYPNSLGGDVLVLLFLAVFWTSLFIYIESQPEGAFDNWLSFWSSGDMPDKLTDEQLNLDIDVKNEQKRVKEKSKNSLVSV